MPEIVETFYFFYFCNQPLSKWSHKMSFEHLWKWANWINFGSAFHITVLKDTNMSTKKLQMGKRVKKELQVLVGKEEMSLWSPIQTFLFVHPIKNYKIS